MLLTITHLEHPLVQGELLRHEADWGLAWLFRIPGGLALVVEPAAPSTPATVEEAVACSHLATSLLARAVVDLLVPGMGLRPPTGDTLTARVPLAPWCEDGGELLGMMNALGFACLATPVATVCATEACAAMSLVVRATCGPMDLCFALAALLTLLDPYRRRVLREPQCAKLEGLAQARLGRCRGWRPAASWSPPPTVVTRPALRSVLGEGAGDPDGECDRYDAEEIAMEARLGLEDARLIAITSALRAVGARRVALLGCGGPSPLVGLARDESVEALLCVDISAHALDTATRRLQDAGLTPERFRSVQLLQSSWLHRDRWLEGHDAIIIADQVEHTPPERLPTMARAAFAARPPLVLVTTPNVEANEPELGLPKGALRRPDHTFEWMHDAFRAWTEQVGRRFGYDCEIRPVGDEHPEAGAPVMLGVFSRAD